MGQPKQTKTTSLTTVPSAQHWENRQVWKKFGRFIDHDISRMFKLYPGRSVCVCVCVLGENCSSLF